MRTERISETKCKDLAPFVAYHIAPDRSRTVMTVLYGEPSKKVFLGLLTIQPRIVVKTYVLPRKAEFEWAKELRDATKICGEDRDNGLIYGPSALDDLRREVQRRRDMYTPAYYADFTNRVLLDCIMRSIRECKGEKVSLDEITDEDPGPAELIVARQFS